MPRSDTDASFRRLVIWPLTAVAVLALTAILVGHSGGGVAVLAGGAVNMIPSSAVALRFRGWRLSGRELTLGRMLAWEASKWLWTAVLFTAVFIGYKSIGPGEVPAPWLFGGFIAAQLAHMTALMKMGMPQHGGSQPDQF